MPRPDDQNPVQELIAEGSGDSLTDRVRARRLWRRPDDLNTVGAENVSKVCVNLLSLSPIRSRSVSIPVPRSIVRFRACWATHAAGRAGRHTGDVQSSGPVLDEEQHVQTADLPGVAGVVGHHQHPPTRQQAAI